MKVAGIMLFLLFLAPLLGHEKGLTLHDGSLFPLNCTRSMRLSVPGKVQVFHQGGQHVFYLSIVPFETQYRVGRLDRKSGEKIEKKLPLEVARYETHKIRGQGHVVFFHATDRSSKQGVLFRVNLNEGLMRAMGKVEDFCLQGSEPLILVPGSGLYPWKLVFHGRELPIEYREKPVLQHNGMGTVKVIYKDFVDLVHLYSMKVIHRETQKGQVVYGDDGALDISVHSELAGPVKESTRVYYRVYVNGRKAGRTETGPERVEVTLNLKLVGGMYYTVKLERWELRKGTGKYVRSNNIHQPDEQKIYLPRGRGVKFSLVRLKNGSWNYVVYGLLHDDG